MIKFQSYELYRMKRLIEDAINRYHLDLRGMRVLTEAGRRYNVLSPAIAAMAGAEKVFAWANDSENLKASEIIDNCKVILEEFGIMSKVEFSANEKNISHIENADIITNSAMLRPLDSDFLKHINNDLAVVSLMYDAWELRESDVDIDYCEKNNIKVVATWENHPELPIFEAFGNLAVKMANDAGFEVFNNNIIIWSEDLFGIVVEDAFRGCRANSVLKTHDPECLFSNLEHCDFIFFCDFNKDFNLLSEKSVVDVNELKRINPGVGIIHLYGLIDSDYLVENGIRVYPQKQGKKAEMTFNFSHLGPSTLIHHITAGLKVGECHFKGLHSALCQDIV